MRFCFFIVAVFFQWTAHSTEIHFLDSRLDEKDKGQRLILTFYPKVPEYSAIYVKDKNASEVRWKALSLEKHFRKYLFPNTNKPFTEIYVWADPTTKKGILQLWHKNSNSYQLTKISDTELALVITSPPITPVPHHLRPPSPPSPITAAPMPVRRLASVVTPDPDPVPVQKIPPKTISLNLKQTPLDKVLRTVATEADRSMVFGEEVTGSITINLKNVAYEDAVNMILKATKYRAEHTGNVSIIRSAKEGKSFRVFQLKYVDVSAVLKSVQDLVKEGQATADTNSNTIFVSDTMDSLGQIERMLESLDQIPRQVDVETAIIELEEDNAKQLGVNIGGTTKNGTVFNTIASNRISPFDPAAAAPKGMLVGLSWQSVQAMLGALEQTSKLTILARPRIVALNDQEASIIIGSKIGYKTLTVTTTGTVEDVKFLTVGTQLKIKPHITLNNDVLMQIKPEVSDGGLDAKTGIPTETTTSSETKVLARDGQTIIIGGLLRDRTEKKEDRVPILADIPLVGFFFKGVTQSIRKTEVMILLVPRIVNQAVLRTQEKEAELAIDRIYGKRLNVLPPPTRTDAK